MPWVSGRGGTGHMEFTNRPCLHPNQLNCSGSLMRAVPGSSTEAGEEFLKNYFPVSTPPSEISDLVFEKGSSWPVSLEKKTHLIDVAMFKASPGASCFSRLTASIPLAFDSRI